MSEFIPGQDGTPVSAPKSAVPQPPPTPAQGVSGPTYVAHDGHIWHRSMNGWWTLETDVAARLLAGYRADALNTDDWFHARATELADELARAIADVWIARETEQAA